MLDSEEGRKKQVLEVFISVIRDNLSEKAETYTALEEKFGSEVVEVVEKVKGKRVRKAWMSFAEKQESTSLDHFIAAVWKPSFDLFDCSISKNSESEIQMNVTRCIFADIARELGVADWGFRLFCKDDPHMVEGYNPKMEFRRTKTLMEGDDCCDHWYRLEEV